MDILKELFGSVDDLQVLLGSNGALQSPVANDGKLGVISPCTSANEGHGQIRGEEPLGYPLPLLPTDISRYNVASSSVFKQTKSLPASPSIPSESNSSRSHREPVEVPSEMPMYLLAEDEGNEEEILRLLESASPAGSPDMTDNSTNSSHTGNSLIMDSVTHPNSNHQDSLVVPSGHRSSSVPPTFSHLPLESCKSGVLTLNAPAHIQEVYRPHAVKRREIKVNRRDSPRKKQHGGGWPKGKSRKPQIEVALPKPPATGYSLYISENRLAVQQQCGTKSMSVLSRRLGKMWAELGPEQKNEYYSRAKADRVRYIEELKKYLSYSYKGMNLEKAESFIRTNFSGEDDDSVLACQICQLNFASLYNKQSHYAGKLHLQTFLQHLNQLMEKQPQQLLETCSSDINSEASTSLRIIAEYDCCREKHSLLKVKIKKDLEMNAILQQQYMETEYCRWSQVEILSHLRTKEILMKRNIQNLMQSLRTFQKTDLSQAKSQ